MRKFLLIVGVISLLSYGGFETSEINNFTENYSAIDCKIGQCNATAKSTGNRCKHCVSTSGDLYCWQHK